MQLDIMIYMHKKPLNKKAALRRFIMYGGMTLVVIVAVALIELFISGYRFDSDQGRIEQYALLQFNSNPAGAIVSVDGESLNVQTPNKVTVPAGVHVIQMSKTGYETWAKTVNVKSGILVWLNYALLVPNVLTVEPIASFPEVNQTITSPDGHYILIQNRADAPIFDLVDINSTTTKTTKLTIPVTTYSEAATTGIVHTFSIDKWDAGGRYALIKHIYGDKSEWLVLDTQDANLTRNITRLFDFAISCISFSGTSGNIFYALGGSDIRKIDLSAGTISRPLVSGVTSFSTYNSSILSYIGTGALGTNQQIVGLYRDGDDNPYIVQTIEKTDSLPINVSVARYFSQYYVAISNGKIVNIFSGSYPISASDSSSFKALTSLTVDEVVENLSFSPTGQHVLVQSGAYFASYDLEYQSLSSSSVAGTDAVSPLRWLNDNYLWSDRGGSLRVFEFDGANVHTINSVVTGQTVALTSNGRYLYSFSKVDAVYQLQRVRMILP